MFRTAIAIVWIALAGPVQDAFRALRRYNKMRHVRT